MRRFFAVLTKLLFCGVSVCAQESNLDDVNRPAVPTIVARNDHLWVEQIEPATTKLESKLTKPLAESRVRDKDLELWIGAAKEYAPGAPLKIELSLVNLGDKTLTLTDGDPDPGWVFELVSEEGKSVPLTPLGRLENSREMKIGKTIYKDLPTGYRLIRTTDIGPYFRIDKSGTYSLRVRRVVNIYIRPTPRMVESGSLLIKIAVKKAD